jgi:hypothetical protein
VRRLRGRRLAKGVTNMWRRQQLHQTICLKPAPRQRAVVCVCALNPSLTDGVACDSTVRKRRRMVYMHRARAIWKGRQLVSGKQLQGSDLLLCDQIRQVLLQARQQPRCCMSRPPTWHLHKRLAQHSLTALAWHRVTRQGPCDRDGEGMPVCAWLQAHQLDGAAVQGQVLR